MNFIICFSKFLGWSYYLIIFWSIYYDFIFKTRSSYSFSLLVIKIYLIIIKLFSFWNLASTLTKNLILILYIRNSWILIKKISFFRLNDVCKARIWTIDIHFIYLTSLRYNCDTSCALVIILVLAIKMKYILILKIIFILIFKTSHFFQIWSEVFFSIHSGQISTTLCPFPAKTS